MNKINIFGGINMYEKISIRKDNSKIVCVSCHKKRNLNQWFILTLDDYLFNDDGTESELLSKEEIRHCYKGYLNRCLFLPVEELDKNEVEKIFKDLSDENCRVYIECDRILNTNEVYQCDQNKDFVIYMSSEEALDGYNDYNHRYLYMGEISGNLIRPLSLISGFLTLYMT